MTQQALPRLQVVVAVGAKRLPQGEAARQWGVTRRPVPRWVADYRREGAAGLVSRRRGKPSNRRLQDPLRDHIRALRVARYADFSPPLAREKWLEVPALEVSIETVRQLLTALGLWQPKVRQAARAFQARERRARCGELIQIDGSPHDGFEGRGPLHPDRVQRRRDGASDPVVLRPQRDHRGLPGGVAPSPGPVWAPGGALRGSSRHLPDQPGGPGQRPYPDPVRTLAGGPGDRGHPCPHAGRPRGGWGGPTRPARTAW